MRASALIMVLAVLPPLQIALAQDAAEVSFEEKLLDTIPEKAFRPRMWTEFSPDGRHVAYYTPNTATGGGAWTVDGVTAEEFHLAGMVVEETYPAIRFSMDGKHFAYWAEKENKWFVVLDGRKGEESDSCFSPGGLHVVFSPDGKKIAFGARVGRELWWKVIGLAE